LAGILDVCPKVLDRDILTLRRQCIKGCCLNRWIGILQVITKDFPISISCSRLQRR
jgi:hypothetical protein